MFIMSKNKTKIALISSNMAGHDYPVTHEKQSIPYDSYLYTDENFPLRTKAMGPRMQSKIPKCFGWQLAPDYDYYMWLDASICLFHRDSLKHFLDNCQGHDIVAFPHHRRPNIWEEYRYIRRGLWQSSYITSRYENEFLDEQMQVIRKDKSYKDDTLLLSGMFMYRNTPQVQSALKEWWYHITRYHVVDQLAFPYVIKKAGLKLKLLPDVWHNCWYLKTHNHKHRRK